MNTEELRQFLKPSIALAVGGAVVMALGLVFGIAGHVLVALIILLAIGGVLLYFGVKEQTDFKRLMEEYARQGTLEEIAADFAAGRTWSKDTLRTGEKYCYNKGSGRVYPYTDIRNVHQYVHKTNGVEDQRQLRAVMADSKTVTLCTLKLRGRSDEELQQLIMLLLSKNPSITVGYRR